MENIKKQNKARTLNMGESKRHMHNGKCWPYDHEQVEEKNIAMISALEKVKAVTGIVLLIAAGIGMYTVAKWLF